MLGGATPYNFIVSGLLMQEPLCALPFGFNTSIFHFKKKKVNFHKYIQS